MADPFESLMRHTRAWIAVDAINIIFIRAGDSRIGMGVAVAVTKEGVPYCSFISWGIMFSSWVAIMLL